MEEDERNQVVRSVCYAKDAIRAKVQENFYTQAALKNYTNEKYMNG